MAFGKIHRQAVFNTRQGKIFYYIAYCEYQTITETTLKTPYQCHIQLSDDLGEGLMSYPKIN